MARATSTVYPELVVTDLGVTFNDGHAEVDAKTADALAKANIEGVSVEAVKRSARSDEK